MLPVSASMLVRPGAMKSVSAIDQGPPMKGPTVLIADDETTIASTLSLVLQSHGYRTVVAHTGEEALELAMASSPDALICDIIMPGMNGIEAALQIRAVCSDCRIILISGDIRSTELLERANAEGNHFEVLAKPFHPTRLLDLLKGGPPVITVSC